MSVKRSLALGDVLAEHARSYPGREATVDGAVRLTWTALEERVNRLANALQVAGFEAGDRFLWLGQNSFRILEALLAVGKLGGMLCPANWRQSAAEAAFVYEDLQPRVVAWQADAIGDMVRTVRAKVGDDAVWLQHDGDGDDSYESFLGRGAPDDPAFDVDADRPVLVLYTAAFEGRPNGAVLSHENLLAQAMVLAYIYDVDHDFVFLNSGPLFHIGTFMWTAAVFAFGAKNVFVPRVDVEEICNTIEAERCTWAFLVPPTIAEIRALAERRRIDLSSLRVGQYTDLWEGLAERSSSRGGRFPGGFGQTEVTGLVIWAAIGAPGEGQHGRPPPVVQARLVDDEGREVAPGEVGEVVARGAVVGHGYWNRPELNERRMVEGWWHTNDLGRREADGSITFVGPKTRLIKSGVENVYPAEVESCLRGHPAVTDVAVIGVPEPRFVQAVKAIVVLEAGSSTTAEELVEHCRASIASYKKPRYVEFVDSLPRTVGGLTDYARLDREFGGGNYPGGDTPVSG